jgi:hypothetical protein
MLIENAEIKFNLRNSPTTARLRIFPMGGVVDTWNQFNTVSAKIYG